MIREPEFRKSKQRREPVRILLLEDDPDFAELLRAQLRRMPFVQSRLEAVGTLADALARLASGTFGLVLADLNLPDSVGVGTVKVLAEAAEQPVIVLTADREPALRAQCMEAGAYDFLTKDQLSATALERLVRLAAIQANTLRSLRESETRFGHLLNLSTHWHWEQDEEFRYTRFEGRVDELLGSDTRPALGRRRWEIPSNEPVHGTWDEHRAALEAHLPFRNFETRRVGDDGRTHYVIASGDPVFDAKGRFCGYYGVAAEISARKQAEAALQQSEELFRQTFELAGSGIAHVDLDGRFRRVNRRLCEILGYQEEDLVGRSVKEISHPDDRDVTDAQRARLRTDELHSVQIEKRYRRRDGATVWVDLTVALARDARGAPLFEISIMEDITRRKHEEGLLALEHEVTRCLAESDTASDGLIAVLRALAARQDWPCGRYFAVDEDANVLRFVEAWGLPDPAVERFIAESRAIVYARGSGLSGLVWQSGEALWVRDVSRDPRVSGATRATLQGGAFVFPVTSGERILGVLSFSSGSVREPDARLLQAVRVIGSQVGQFLMRKKAERKQRQRAEDLQRFRAAMDMLLDAIYLTDRATMSFVDVNEAACRGLGYSREQLLQMGPHDFLSVPRAELERDYDAVIAEGAGGVRLETAYTRKDGRKGWTELHRRALRSGDKWIIVTISRDISERKIAEERQATHVRYQERVARFGKSALAKREPAELIAEAVQTVLEALAADAVAYFEAGLDRQLVVRALVGVADSASHPAAVSCGSDNPALEVLRSGTRLLVGGAKLELAWASRLRNVALIPVRGEDGVRGVLCTGYRDDVFAGEALNFVEAAASVLSAGLQRIDSEGRLAYLAQFDPLTGLPNRALLADRFSQMIGQARRRGSALAVLFIDLDGFKLVNDTLGHAGGDALLKETAVRLQASVRTGDTVARISGDEFAVVLADLAHLEDAALVALKIIERLAVAFDVHDKEVFVTASVGIAVFPGDGADAESLIGAADAAMYRAKQSGRNAFQFFTAEINQRSRARAQLGVELRHALERGEFELAYQPKIDLSTRRPTGAEALMRWKHPHRGMVSPVEFIPVLEETGLIIAAGDWVLARACEDLKAWQAAGLPPLPVSVNLSARQFRQQDLDARIKSLVAAAGVHPALIELEITESQLMQEPDQAIRVMRALRDAGMRIAIDDFGTGYSSLAYLTRFPVGSLKIDRSFVKEMSSDHSDATIVRTIIEMAHTLGFTVVAEGVETEQQATFLRLLRCEQAQGYLFARPMPAAQFAAFCQRGG